MPQHFGMPISIANEPTNGEKWHEAQSLPNSIPGTASANHNNTSKSAFQFTSRQGNPPRLQLANHPSSPGLAIYLFYFQEVVTIIVDVTTDRETYVKISAS